MPLSTVFHAVTVGSDPFIELPQCNITLQTFRCGATNSCTDTNATSPSANGECQAKE